jgi:hypothetical protein
MTAEDKASLKAWAENWYAGIGQVQARQALELLAENETLAAQVEVFRAESCRLRELRVNQDGPLSE